MEEARYEDVKVLQGYIHIINATVRVTASDSRSHQEYKHEECSDLFISSDEYSR